MIHSVDVREDLKQPISKEQAAADVAWLQEWSKRLDEINKESPLPDDFEEYCKGQVQARRRAVLDEIDAMNISDSDSFPDPALLTREDRDARGAAA
jgi:hypothetical protein